MGLASSTLLEPDELEPAAARLSFVVTVGELDELLASPAPEPPPDEPLAGAMFEVCAVGDSAASSGRPEASGAAKSGIGDFAGAA